jgi:hypothetical protein
LLTHFSIYDGLLTTINAYIAGICRTHPGRKECTVAFYYRKFELAESLHGAPRRGATDQAQLDDLAAQLEPEVLGKVLATLSSTHPAARLLGISKSAMQRRKGPLVRAVQRQQQQRPKDEFWYTRDPDALEKELHHLRKCCLDEKSLDLVMFSASEDNLCSLIVEAHNLHCTRMRLVIDEAQAKHRKNRQWLREIKGAGIPVKTGRTASTMVHNKWGIINGKFVLEGTGNFGVDAFTSKHAESYGTRWDEAAGFFFPFAHTLFS